jgi:hypothetical protein
MTSWIRRVFALLALGLAGVAAAPDPYPAATVVVYPLTVSGGGDPTGEVGSNIAVLISNKLAELGGLTVKPYRPGTTRADYLSSALKDGADYYVTGFLTPVGTDVSLIVQVVSTYSGSVVFSTTVVARTYADAVGQADIVRGAILRHAGRGFAAIDAPAPAPSPSKAALTDDGHVNLTKALGRHSRGAPAATPSPAAGTTVALGAAPSSPAKASPVPTNILVLQAAGDADDKARAYATSSLSSALRNEGAGGGLLPVTVEQGIAHAAQLCSANAGTHALYAPTLALARDPKGVQSVALDVAAYDCKAVLLGRQHAVAVISARGGIDSAIDDATSRVTVALKKSLP